MEPKHIMVIDDDWLNRELMEAVFTSSGYTITLAHSGADALKKIMERTPDLFLVDVLMPDMDGFEVCASLKANPNTANVPVLLTTALEFDADELAHADTVGASGVINRSMPASKIVEKVAAQLSQT